MMARIVATPSCAAQVLAALLATGIAAAQGQRTATQDASGFQVGHGTAEVHTVPVLMYHIVGNRPGDLKDHDCFKPGLCEQARPDCPRPGAGPPARGLGVSFRDFDWQMKFLLKNGYRTLTLEEAFGDNPVKLKDKDVVLTFDDGYADNFEAYQHLKRLPILQLNAKYVYKANLFMVSNNVDCQGRLSSEQLRAMDADNFQVHSHSRTHRKGLESLGEDEQAAEYLGSREILGQVLGREVDFVSYPEGRFTAETLDAVRKAGYKGAFIVGNRIADRLCDKHRLPRFRVSNNEEFLRAIKAGLRAASGYEVPPCP